MTDTFIGRSLGKYEVEKKLGQGGMGMVYLGRQRSLNRAVAIKVLPAQMAMDTDFVERFRQEAQVIAGLQHESIVHVYDIDHITTDSGESIYFIVMEYVDGHNLRQRPDRHVPMSWQKVRAVGLPVARALDYAHRRGIVHRDIKPANVMETKDGKIKLMDFGIAKSAGGVKTATGSVLGTPEYMAPEQAQTGQVTPRSDIYSLGVLLYELATGRLPFEAGEPFAVALKHISEAPAPPTTHVPGLPPWLERVILRSLEKNPDDRFPDAAALAHALDRAGADPSSSPSLVQTDRSGPPVLPTELGPTVVTPPSGISAGVDAAVDQEVDPAAPTLQTPASASPVAPTLPAPTPPPVPATEPVQAVTPPPPPVPPPVGPDTEARGPVAWWPAVAVVAVLALVAAFAIGYFVIGTGDAGQEQPSRAALGALNAAEGGDLSEAERHLAAGDLQAARRQVDAYLAQNPDDAVAVDLERRLSHAEDSLAQALAAGDLLGEIDGAPSELDEPPSDDATGTPDQSSTQAKPKPDAAGATDIESIASPDTRQVRPPPPPPPPPPPAPSLRELVRRARGHRANDEYHSLRKVLAQIDERGPGLRDAELQKWARKVDGWVEDREDDLRDEVDDLLDEFADAVEDEDLGDLSDVWGDSIDSRTADYFSRWWQTYRKSKAEYDIQSVDPWDHEAGFVATVRLYGKKERRDDMRLVRTVTWRGRIRDKGGVRIISPFPG